MSAIQNPRFSFKTKYGNDVQLELMHDLFALKYPIDDKKFLFVMDIPDLNLFAQETSLVECYKTLTLKVKLWYDKTIDNKR